MMPDFQFVDKLSLDNAFLEPTENLPPINQLAFLKVELSIKVYLELTCITLELRSCFINVNFGNDFNKCLNASQC